VPVLDRDMRRVVLEQKLGFVATVCPDGTPNLSPKGTTTVWDDDHLLFADIRSPQTLRNLKEKPVAEINVVDPIVRKGYRFKGRATLHSDDEIYKRGLALLVERGYDARPDRVRTIVLVKIGKQHRSSHRRMTEGPPRRSLQRAGSGTWRTS
jgi:predicted pyridoxine 5'-phosphate oxidase superfamily flavin-nucleotide-binding protein